MIICKTETCQQNGKKKKNVGETERKLKDRISEYVGYINTKKLDQATGHHFNLPGRGLNNMKVTLITEKKEKPIL